MACYAQRLAGDVTSCDAIRRGQTERVVEVRASVEESIFA